jgi:cytidine deaminase
MRGLAMGSDGWFLLLHMDWEPLIEAAWKVREMAHAPYSKFHVGAALRVEGEVFTGCNVENLSYGLTNCAERVAMGTAVAAGKRRVEAVAVVADTAVPISPCGACRQVLAEFAGEGDPLVCLANRTERVVFRLSELLPRASAGILDLPERS